MDDINRGMYQKFVVHRVDRQDFPGKKHYNCRYFVLDIDHDPYARPALIAYADSCENEYPKLAADIRAQLGVINERV